MKTLGIILLLIGLAGTLVFGVQAIQDTESFRFLGLDITVSKANWTPVYISVAVLIIGIVLTVRGKK